VPKLLKSDKPSLSYNRQCRSRIVFWDTVYNGT